MQIITRADARSLGLKRYFTGEPCSRGHLKERRISDHGCVECSRLKAASPAERERRREYMAAHQRAYRKKRPDRVRASKLKHGHAALAAYKRKLRAKDPERYRAALRRSFQKHKAKRMEETRQWKKNNPEATSLHLRAAKAKRRAAEGKYCQEDILWLLVTQRELCTGCGVNLSDDFHIDHMTPLVRGGTNWPENLQLLCPPCNKSKGAKTMPEWAAWKMQCVAA